MNTPAAYLEDLIVRYPKLESAKADIQAAFEMISGSYRAGGKLLVAGNGGSAADSEHIVGELMKGFLSPRKLTSAQADALKAVDKEMGETLAGALQQSLPAIALDGHVALTTAYMNDCNPLLSFAQQVNGYGCANDVLLAISTSGKSRNILYAAVAAKAKGIKVVALTGETGSPLGKYADVCIKVPGNSAYLVQEYHLPVYHCLCLMLEACFFGE